MARYSLVFFFLVGIWVALIVSAHNTRGEQLCTPRPKVDAAHLSGERLRHIYFTQALHHALPASSVCYLHAYNGI
jgi:hypothetical protein